MNITLYSPRAELLVVVLLDVLTHPFFPLFCLLGHIRIGLLTSGSKFLLSFTPIQRDCNHCKSSETRACLSHCPRVLAPAVPLH